MPAIHLGEAAFPNLQRCTVVDGADLAFGPYGVKVFKVPHGDTGWVLGKLLHGKTPNTLTLSPNGAVSIERRVHKPEP